MQIAANGLKWFACRKFLVKSTSSLFMEIIGLSRLFRPGTSVAKTVAELAGANSTSASHPLKGPEFACIPAHFSLTDRFKFLAGGKDLCRAPVLRIEICGV
ncbi:MAG: hypothetical protein ACREE6_09315 [Limisphaerales bacterium]